MSLDDADVVGSLSKGWGIFCATCPHLYKGIELSLDGCVKVGCGGPIRGLDFPDYDGVIPRASFGDICLVCGRPESSTLVFVKGKHTFSLCDEHKRSLDVITNSDVKLTPIISSVGHVRHKRESID